MGKTFYEKEGGDIYLFLKCFIFRGFINEIFYFILLELEFIKKLGRKKVNVNIFKVGRIFLM